MNRWKTNSKVVYNLSYHIIWCPKYRRKVLTDGVDTRLKQLLEEQAVNIGVELVELEVVSDHVHIFVRTTPDIAPNYVAGMLKGYTSRILRQEFPKLRSRLPTLWSRSYYVDSVGRLTENAIRQYIQEQNK